jgi:hypothetical protein
VRLVEHDLRRDVLRRADQARGGAE